MIVVDTNVVSELMKPAPDAVVRGWVQAHVGDALYTTAITLAEINYGLERLPAGRRREALKTMAEEVLGAFQGQIFGFDAAAAAYYARIAARRDSVGLPIDGFDAQIAAICGAHNVALATRNAKDFRHTDIDLIDPWQSP